MDGAIREFGCLHCLTDGSCQMKLDKKGRPFTRCWSCGTMVFLHSDRAFLGLNHLAGMVGSIRDQLSAADSAAATREYAELRK